MMLSLKTAYVRVLMRAHAQRATFLKSASEMSNYIHFVCRLSSAHVDRSSGRWPTRPWLVFLRWLGLDCLP